MNKKFILGMVATSLVANSALAISLNERIQQSFPEATSRTTLKDAGIMAADLLTVSAIVYFFPRVDKKTLSAKTQELELTRKVPTAEELNRQIRAIDDNINNFMEVRNDGRVLSAGDRLGSLHPEVLKEIDTMRAQSAQLQSEIARAEKELAEALRETARIQGEIDGIKNVVSNYESLHVDSNKDGVVDANEQSQSKLKAGPQAEVEKRTRQLTFFANQSESAKVTIAESKNAVNKIDSAVAQKVQDIKNRSILVLKPEVAGQRAKLAEITPFSVEEKAKRIAALEAEIKRIAQRGVRGAGIKLVKAVSVVGGVVLVADLGIRGTVVIGYNKDAGWVPGYKLAKESCEDQAMCDAALTKLSQAAEFVGEAVSDLASQIKSK